MPLKSDHSYGRELVRAQSSPHPGQVITGVITSNGPNQYHFLVSASTPIKGVSVCMLAENAGTGASAVRVIQATDPSTQGARLWTGRPALNLEVDDLRRVRIFIPTAGDGVDFIAIAQGGEPVP